MTRRFRRAPRRLVVILCVLAALAAIKVWLVGPLRQARPPLLGEGKYRVERVVDGDTLVVEGGVRVRLIGVDTPETVKPNAPVEPLGREAAEFTRRFADGRVLRIELDRERLDRYGRTLAYVWNDRQMLNEELLRSGLARWEPQYHYSAAKKNRFAKAEQEARRARRGIWAGK